MRMLQDNGLDLGFVSYPAGGESLRTELIIKEELVLFSPQNSLSKLSIDDLLGSSDLPLIVQRQACSYSERFLSYLRDNNLPAPRVVEAGSLEALLGLVEQGLGVTIAPRTLISERKRSIRTIPLKPLGAKRWVNVYLLSNQSARNSALKRFVEHCQERFAGSKSHLCSSPKEINRSRRNRSLQLKQLQPPGS